MRPLAIWRRDGVQHTELSRSKELVHLLKVRAETEMPVEIEGAASRAGGRDGELASLRCVLGVAIGGHGREPFHAAAQEHEHEAPITRSRLRRHRERETRHAYERSNAAKHL